MTSSAAIHLTHTPPRLDSVELVERKGLGHPDTICDAIAEEFSRALSHYYVQHFGVVLHHNVDKALLCGGRSRVSFGGGDIVEPMDLYLAGRATTDVGGHEVPVRSLAVQSARKWFAEHLPEVDLERHLRIHCVVREGSADLKDVFGRAPAGTAVLANDTSLGVGYAPLSPFESLVLDIERELNSPAFRTIHPQGGADVKVMGWRDDRVASITVARAFVSRRVSSLSEYRAGKQAVEEAVRQMAEARGLDPDVGVNVADDPEGNAVYLTLTGTSAEAGDDGQVGRGNRANGLITPSRPMSLEAVAGKNPVTHAGKLYNVAAKEIAEQIVEALPDVSLAACYLLSEIGRPIVAPRSIRVELTTAQSGEVESNRPRIQELVWDYLADLPMLTRRLLEGSVLF